MAAAALDDGEGPLTLWQRLIAPAAGVTDAAERRTARLLSTLLILLLPLAVVSVGAQMAQGQGVQAWHVAMLGAIAALVGTYLLSRTVHFRIAAAITTTIPTMGGLAVVASDASDPGWFAFMALNPALGTLLLSMRRATALATLNLVCVAAGIALAADLESDTAIVAVMFNVITSVVLIAAARHRGELERLRRSELIARQRLNERILESSFGGVAIHERGRIVQANAVFGQMFGIEPEALIGVDIQTLVEPASQERIRAVVTSADGHPVEVLARRADGSTFDAEVLVPRADDDIDSEGEAMAVQDIAERLVARDALVRAGQIESVGRLAAGLAHDTNNQLAVISGNAEILGRDAGGNRDAVERAQIIREASAQIATLVRRMMLVGRTEPPVPEVVEVAAFIERLRPMWERLVGPRVRLSITRGPGSAAVLIDPTLLEQVLLNLVLNARDAMPGGGRLDVEHDADDLPDQPLREGVVLPAGRYQRIRVADAGHGIPQEHVDKVFRPFFTTRVHEGGTGLGLYMSREVIEQAGGAVTLTTGPRGTTFELVLPESDVPTDASVDDSSGLDVGLDLDVVVVDDNEHVRSALVATLVANDCRVVEAATGEEALTLLEARDGAADVVLTDLTMPGMSGGDLVAEVRTRWPDVRGVVMSGYGDRRAVDVEIALTKPFSTAELVDVLRGRSG